MNKTNRGIETHPVPFDKARRIIVKREHAVPIILDELKNYQDREFIATPEDYGVLVSVNYREGKFVSMILKGTGEQGERVADEIANTIVPKKAKCKKDITLHARLTIQNVNRSLDGLEITVVPRIVKHALRNGLEAIGDKKLVCRVAKIFVGGVRGKNTRHWEGVSDLITPSYSLEYDYDMIKQGIEEDLIVNTGYLLPQHGIIIEDLNPDQEGAFPETHFLFDDTTITIEQKEIEP